MVFETTNFILNLVILIIFIGILYSFYRNATAKPENGDEEQVTLEEYIDKAIDNMGQNIMDTLFSEDNMKMLAEFIQGSLSQSMNSFGLSVDPLEKGDIKKVDQNIGAILANSLGDFNPMAAATLNQIFPEWQEQAQANPQMFMALMKRAENMGIMKYFESIPGFISGGQSNPSNQQSAQPTKKLSW